jgi:hypothetical protein
MRNRRTAKRLIVTAALGLALTACSSGGGGGGKSQVGTSATISHIHGLGIDASGTIHVATHFGLIKAAPTGGWVYASADKDDHMGFSLHAADGIMYRSGHSPARPSLGVEFSNDGGRWTHLSDVANPPVDFHAMAVSFADSKLLWGWDSGGRGTFRSGDGGETWARLEAKGIERQIYVLSGPPVPNVVLAGTVSGLYRSSDGGANFQPVSGAGGGWVAGIAADPKDHKHMLVSTQRGMKTTTDGGATWSDAGGGLPPGAEITSIAISPTDGKIAYAADSAKIYKTADGGTTWSSVPTS